MKKFFKENKVGKFLNSLGTGALKGVPMVGNVVTEMRDNESDDLTGFGKTNVARATSYGLVSVFFIARIIWPEHVNVDTIQEFADILSFLFP